MPRCCAASKNAVISPEASPLAVGMKHTRGTRPATPDRSMANSVSGPIAQATRRPGTTPPDVARMVGCSAVMHPDASGWRRSGPRHFLRGGGLCPVLADHLCVPVVRDCESQDRGAELLATPAAGVKRIVCSRRNCSACSCDQDDLSAIRAPGTDE